MCKKLLHLTPVALVLALLLGNMASAELVGHWAFDESSGTTATDSSGQGNDGEISGDTEWVEGYYGGALMLNGQDGYVNLPIGEVIASIDSISIATWVNFSNEGGPWQRLFDFGNGTSSYIFLCPRTGTAGPMHLATEGNGHHEINASETLPTGWHHVTVVITSGSMLLYLDGLEIGNGDAGTVPSDLGITSNNWLGKSQFSADAYFYGAIDDFRIYDHVVTEEEIQEIMQGDVSAEQASNPYPQDQTTDVVRDVVLRWTSGEFANTHEVYFGLSFDDVNDATKASPEYRTTKSIGDEGYAPENLEFDTAYYWRIDEVNAPPQESTVFKGPVWSFTVEPYAYALAAEQITATASSAQTANMGPEKTIDGSGLDADDLHSTEASDMWLSHPSGPQPTFIQYEFDQAYKLHEMWVWNYNMGFESVVGFGFKDVTVEYSIDGVDWAGLEGVGQFAQGTSEAGYAHNTVVDLKGVTAKYLRLTADSNFQGANQYGLSEVRFFYVPGWAREPDPQDGATGIHPDVVLSWRAGREAATHEVYLSTDEQGVIDGTVAANTVTEASYDGDALALGQTYHWRVDEVNEAEIPAVWPGEIWSFETAAYLVVDDFEGYDDDWENLNRIFQVWIDGAGYTQPEPGHPGNGSGSLVGTAEAPWMESTIVHSGVQAMPISYNNTAAPFYSEAVRTFAVPQDWTKAGVTTLTLYFYGDPANSAGEKMYVKINGVEVPYNGASSDLTHGIWQPWNIELASLVGVDLQNVTELSIGFSGSGSGVVTFDDIRLNPPAQVPDSQAPDDSALVAHWDFEGDFTDATGKGHDGIAFGDPTIVNDPLRGQVLVVDGDDRIGVSDAADLNFAADESLTLTAWANLDLVGAPEGWKGIVAKGRTELGGATAYIPELYGFYVSPENTWSVNAGGIGGGPLAAAGGQWHHLAFVQDGPADEGYFYVDGEVVVAGGADNCDTTGRPFFIGAAGTDVSVFESFKGRIDDVRIYNYALSQLEIQYLALE